MTMLSLLVVVAALFAVCAAQQSASTTAGANSTTDIFLYVRRLARHELTRADCWRSRHGSGTPAVD